MEKRSRSARVFALVGIAALVFSMIAVLIFTQRVGAKRQGEEEPYEVFGFGKACGRENYLVLGCDKAAGLTDVMMLASVDARGKSISLLQIPRDTYAVYSENGYRKLNGALSALGVEGLCAFLGENMGVDIDGYFVFGLDTLCEAVDAVGGVEIELPCDMTYKDAEQGLDISLKKGKQTLNGAAAEQFVRFRSGYLRGDLGRIDAQKLFMAALIRKVKNELSIQSAIKIASSLLGKIETNVSLSKLSSLAFAAFDTDESNIKMATLAGEEHKSRVSGAWFYVLSRVPCQSMMYELFDAQRDFDENGVFRNETSSDFERIYNANVGYEVKNSRDIFENGIEIAKP